MLSLVSGGALMLMGAPIEIAQDAYRSAVAEIQRLTARENAETEAAARKAAEEKVLAEEVGRKAAEESSLAAAAERKAPRKGWHANGCGAAATQEAAKRQAAEDGRLKAEEAARKATEGKPKLDAEVRKQAKRAEADLKLSEQDRKRVQVSLKALGHKIPTATRRLWPTHPGDDHGVAEDARAT